MSGLEASVLEGAGRRIEQWLLESAVQLRTGAQQGGIAGLVDRNGKPEFVYMEITGYYLTTVTWLAAGAASSGERATAALVQGGKALGWMTSVTADGTVPPTRLYLSHGHDDWRNRAIFTFDLAMAARGAACFARASGSDDAVALVRVLAARLREVCGNTVPLPSHALRKQPARPLPDRWSTRPGPHHVKAAAALLHLPPGVLAEDLVRACRETVAYWRETLAASCAVRELHPLLYGLEGMLMLEPLSSEQTLDAVEEAYERLLALQGADGSLPAVAVDPPRGVRADVLAQALRIGALLRAADRLPGAVWRRRLDALAGALLRHVLPNGAVLFSADRDAANAWCAMFAHQALLLHSRIESNGSAGSLPTGPLI